MKRAFESIAFVGIGIVFAVAVSGCQSNKSRAAEGAVIGGVLGAAAGSIIGHQSGETGEGAAIGAAAGILGGSLIGSQIEKSPAQPAATAPAPDTQPAASAFNPQQMSLEQIITLTREGVHEDVIIDRILMSNSRFSLSSADTAYLKQQGVSDKVIGVMTSAR
ncbi:MAG: glycine zipper domain-containing protein [Candidatus Omnitrophica bacterium]|nr:glycine zipper domain-containing protein [Candidatus Omnitrophota bacterium]